MRSTSDFSDSRNGGVEALLAGQNRILEMIAHDAPLEETLTSLVFLIESQFEGMLCSVVLLDEDGQHIHHGAAPSLPDPYRKAIDGIVIGPKVGSCGTAMFRGAPVIVTDIMEDPLWEDYRTLASQHGLRACWSTPIASHQGKILGSFAMYYREPRSPGPVEMQLITEGTRIAGIAIERYQADVERRRVAENYRALVENLNDVVFSLDAEGRFSYVSPIIENLSGYSVPEVLGKRFSLFVHPEDLSSLEKSFASTVAGEGGPFEFRVFDKSGRVRWCRSSSRRMLAGERVVGLIGILQDISDRKQAEEASSFLASIVQSASGAIISKTVEGIITSWNPGAEALYGYSAEEALGRSISFLVPPSRADEVHRLIERAVADRNTFHHETVRVRKDGSKIDVSLTISPVRVEAGPITHVCTLAHDITERKNKERRLREFERVVEGVEEMIAVVDSEYRYVIANQAFLRYRGMTKEQVIGKRVADVLDPEVFEKSVKEKLDECFKGNVVRFKLRYQYPELGERDLFISYFPIEDSDCIGRVACILRDITEQNQAEEALRTSEARERAKSRELETVLDTVPASVYIARDAECRYMTTNRAGYEELGLPIGTNVSRSALPPSLPGLRFMRDGVEVPTQELPMQLAAATARPVYGVPLSLIFEDGTERHTVVNAVPLVGEDGRACGVVGASIDVTERKRAEDALRERERTQKLILDHLSVGVILSSVGEEQSLYQNPRFVELFGYSIKSLADWWPLAYPDPQYREWVSREWQRRLTEAAGTQGEIEPMEVTITCHDGTKKYVRVLAKVIGDLNFVTFIDLSEHKRAEEALKKSEEKFSKAFRQSPMILTLSSIKDDRFVEVNETFERVTGWRRDEVLGRTPFDIGLWVDPSERVELTKRLQTEGRLRNVEARYRMRDGTIRIGLATAEVIELNGEPCMLAVAADITERKVAEEALERSEQNYRMFVAQSSEGIFREDFDAPIPISLAEEELAHRILHESYIAECNDALARMYGVASGRDLTGKRVTEMLVASDARNLQVTRNFIRSGFQIRDRESHEVDSQGNPKVFLNSMTGVVENGKLVRIWGIQKDITEWVRLDEARRKTEEALRNAELKYRTIFEEAVVGIFQTTPEGKLLIANPALARMFGYDSAEEFMASVNDRSRRVYVFPESRQEFMQIVQQKGSVRDFEIQVYRKDGATMWLSVTARAIRENGVVVSHEGMCQDITDHKVLVKQLLQAQKMDALGSLAAGIAHDFNNVLGVILGQGELLLQKLAPSDASRRRVEQICEAGRRAASLTERLLAFSRQQIRQPSLLDLNGVVEHFSNMVASLIGEDVTLVRLLDPELGRVSADASQIEQILMNLVVNARDAMPGGGGITIQTSNMEMDEAFARQHARTKQGPYVLLTVRDTGTGMDEQTAAQIFEPFFTTKEVGKGTGLGLSTVYGIVKQSGGHISVESTLGEGTTFSIYLPRVTEAAAAEKWEKKAAPPARGGETILLVEDAAPLREVAREFLKGAGYAVLEAGDAAEALEASEHYSAEISLLITDVVLPGINGHELAERLISRRPRTKVLYISGYTDDGVVRHGVLQSEIAFLKKPFTQDALTQKVRELLDAVA